MYQRKIFVMCILIFFFDRVCILMIIKYFYASKINIRLMSFSIFVMTNICHLFVIKKYLSLLFLYIYQ